MPSDRVGARMLADSPGPLVLLSLCVVPVGLWTLSAPLADRFDGSYRSLTSIAVALAYAGTAAFALNLVLGARLRPAFDLHGSLLAARATLDCALERRETRGAHNRSDFPAEDPALRLNLVWSADGSLSRHAQTLPSDAVASLAGDHELEVSGRLLE